MSHFQISIFVSKVKVSLFALFLFSVRNPSLRNSGQTIVRNFKLKVFDVSVYCRKRLFKSRLRAVCRTFKFRFLYEKSRFHFLSCFCFKSEIRVSEILHKPSLGISNSKSLMSVSFAEDVSPKIVCERYLEVSC